MTPSSSRLPAVSCLPRPVSGQHQSRTTRRDSVQDADSPVFVYKDNSVRPQSQPPGEVRPQPLHGLPPGDGEFHRAAGGGDDGQTHGGRTGGALRRSRGDAAEPRRPVHPGDAVGLGALRFLCARLEHSARA